MNFFLFILVLILGAIAGYQEYQLGYDKGYKHGYEDGEEEGYKEGYADGKKTVTADKSTQELQDKLFQESTKTW